MIRQQPDGNGCTLIAVCIALAAVCIWAFYAGGW
jgi:hypothetical protein